jgi:hypothetical protein
MVTYCPLPDENRARLIKATGGEMQQFIGGFRIQPRHKRAGRPSAAGPSRLITEHQIVFHGSESQSDDTLPRATSTTWRKIERDRQEK